MFVKASHRLDNDEDARDAFERMPYLVWRYITVELNVRYWVSRSSYS